jgi:hypothetical protein
MKERRIMKTTRAVQNITLKILPLSNNNKIWTAPIETDKDTNKCATMLCPLLSNNKTAAMFPMDIANVPRKIEKYLTITFVQHV